MRAIPVAYFTEERTIALSVENSLYNDIVKLTGINFWQMILSKPTKEA